MKLIGTITSLGNGEDEDAHIQIRVESTDNPNLISERVVNDYITIDIIPYWIKEQSELQDLIIGDRISIEIKEIFKV